MPPRAVDETGSRSRLVEGALDSLDAQIAVVDAEGRIVAVNEAWRRFPEETGADAGDDSVGRSYIEASRSAYGPGGEEGREVAAGLADVLAGRREHFTLEYPCHGPARQRWFMLHVTPLRGAAGAVVAHHDITDRKLVEMARAEGLARERAAAEAAAFVARAGEQLERHLDPDRVMAELARLAAEATGTLCFVDLVRHGAVASRHQAVSGERPDPEAVRGLAALAPVALPAEHPVNRVMRSGEAVVHTRIAAEDVERIGGTPERIALLAALPLQSFACLPLTARGALLGVMSVISTRPGRFHPEDPQLALLHDLARRAAQALDNARLYAEQARVARTLQESLLPPRLPALDGVGVSARYRPAARAVGGDFFDVFELGGGAWALAIGDVCGKGAEAAAVTALARHTIRAAARYEDGPAGTLRALNEAILADHQDFRFCTSALAELRRTADGLELVCAGGGHPPPIVLRADGVAVPACRPGTVLGVVEDPVLEAAVTPLHPGDAVLFYTDGLTEAGAPDRLLDWEDVARLAGPVGGDAEELVARLERAALELAGGDPRDDVALLVAVVGG